MDIHLAETAHEAGQALERVDHPVVGVDVERANGQRYFRVAALVQVGVAGDCALLDALALDDLSVLDAFLAVRLSVFHAVENDVDSLNEAGVALDRVADTGVAAGMLGLPLGLDSLLEEVLGVTLGGDKKRMQRADWTQRPLPDEMVAYAAEDVVHLPELWRELESRLEEAGRLEWYEQELEHVLEAARASERSWDATKGAGRLDAEQRGVLESVWEERERIARKEDLAPQVVARDKAIVTAAESPPETLSELKARGLRSDQAARHGEQLLVAVRRGLDAPPIPRAADRRPSTPEDRDAHDRMRKARARVAREVELDPGLVCPSRILWDAVLADPERPEELCDAAGLRPWQRELLADELWDAYRG